MHFVEELVPVAEGVSLNLRRPLPGPPAAPDPSPPASKRPSPPPAPETELSSDPGEGPAPVLLVHGLSSNAKLWDGVAEALASLGHPVAAVDQRGHGRSSKPDWGYDFATLSSDLLAIMGHLGWSSPWLAGQSWGANVVLDLAVRHPGAVSGLVLVDGGMGDITDRFADWETARVALAPPRIEGMSLSDFEKMLRSSHPDWPESAFEATLGNLSIKPDGTVAPWLSLEHHLMILQNLWQHRPSELYPEIAVPVVLVPAEGGGNARWTAGRREQVARAERLLPRSWTCWMAGDHDLHAEHPTEVAALIHQATDGSLFPLKENGI